MQALVASLFVFLQSLGMSVPDQNVVVEYGTPAQRALGECTDGRVILHPLVDLKTVLGRSYLVHELVHYTQDHCPKSLIPVAVKREAIAYEVQNLYLQQNGEEPIANPYYMALFENREEKLVEIYLKANGYVNEWADGRK